MKALCSRKYRTAEGHTFAASVYGRPLGGHVVVYHDVKRPRHVHAREYTYGLKKARWLAGYRAQ